MPGRMTVLCNTNHHAGSCRRSRIFVPRATGEVGCTGSAVEDSRWRQQDVHKLWRSKLEPVICSSALPRRHTSVHQASSFKRLCHFAQLDVALGAPFGISAPTTSNKHTHAGGWCILRFLMSAENCCLQVASRCPAPVAHKPVVERCILCSEVVAFHNHTVPADVWFQTLLLRENTIVVVCKW